MWVLTLLVVLAALVLAIFVGGRVIARLWPQPCPPSLIGVLNNPFSRRYRAAVLDRLSLEEGLSVLDAGCGPGLLTVPIAKAIGPRGHVLGLDVQAEMVERARQAAQDAGAANVGFLVASLGEGRLPELSFDRATLLTVLGEIRDRPAALREIYHSLKPGGFLSITELFFDPDYQSRTGVRQLALDAGFRVRGEFGNWFMFTLNVERPAGA